MGLEEASPGEGRWLGHVRAWWEALVKPATASGIILGGHARRGFFPFLVIAIFVLYLVYGISMGLFAGVYPALVSGLKMPFLYLLSVAVCFPAFYVLNCVAGPRLDVRSGMRLLLVAVSANAIAVCSYAPISYFFVLTTSRDGYHILVMMHVVVLGLSGMASVVASMFVFRATSAALGRRFDPGAILTWGSIYALVGTQMSWALRPWIVSPDVPYAPLRHVESSFVQAVWRLLVHLAGG